MLENPYLEAVKSKAYSDIMEYKGKAKDNIENTDFDSEEDIEQASEEIKDSINSSLRNSEYFVDSNVDLVGRLSILVGEWTIRENNPDNEIEEFVFSGLTTFVYDEIEKVKWSINNKK